MSKFNFDFIRKQLQQTEREILVLLSNQAQNYFLQSFKNQSWDGKKWQEVKRRAPGTKAYEYPKKKGLQRRTSPILVGAGWKTRGGTLRTAVSVMARTAQINNSGFKMILDVPYAVYHNEGMGNNPKRQFVGQTAELSKMQKDKITQTIDKIWRV